MSKPTLLFIGPVDSRSGYGEHSKSIVNSLLKIDKYDIKILSIRWGTLPRSALKKGIDDEIISKIIPTPNLPKKPTDEWGFCTLILLYFTAAIIRKYSLSSILFIRYSILFSL